MHFNFIFVNIHISCTSQKNFFPKRSKVSNKLLFNLLLLTKSHPHKNLCVFTRKGEKRLKEYKKIIISNCYHTLNMKTNRCVNWYNINISLNTYHNWTWLTFVSRYLGMWKWNINLKNFWSLLFKYRIYPLTTPIQLNIYMENFRVLR